VVQNEGEEGGKNETRRVPDQFGEVLKEFWRGVKEKVGEQEIRALGVGQVAGPAIQVRLLRFEREGAEEREERRVERRGRIGFEEERKGKLTRGSFGLGSFCADVDRAGSCRRRS